MEGRCVLQRYGPTSDGRLSIRWRPLYLEADGSEGYHGAEAVKLTIDISQVFMLAPLVAGDDGSGVVDHSVSRALDNSKRRVGDVVVEPDLDGELKFRSARARGQPVAGLTAAALDGPGTWKP